MRCNLLELLVLQIAWVLPAGCAFVPFTSRLPSLKEEVRQSNAYISDNHPRRSTTPHMAMPKFQISFFPPDREAEENKKRLKELETEMEMLNALLTNEKILRQDLENQILSVTEEYQEKSLHYQTKMSDKQSKYRKLQQKVMEMNRKLKKQDEDLEEMREKQEDMEHQQKLLQYESEIEQLTKDEKLLSSEADLLLQIGELTAAFETAQASAAKYREELSLYKDNDEAVMNTNRNCFQSFDAKGNLLERLSKTASNKQLSDDVQSSKLGDDLAPDLLNWAKQKMEIDFLNESLRSLHESSPNKQVEEVIFAEHTEPNQVNTEKNFNERDESPPAEIMQETGTQQVTMHKPKRKSRKIRTLSFDTHGVLP